LLIGRSPRGPISKTTPRAARNMPAMRLRRIFQDPKKPMRRRSDWNDSNSDGRHSGRQMGRDMVAPGITCDETSKHSYLRDKAMEGSQSSVAPKPQTRLSTIEIAVNYAVSRTKQLATLRLA